MKPAQLKQGDVVWDPVRGLLATVTHVRKHRSYAGYYAVQVRLDGDDRVTQWDVKAGVEVVVVKDPPWWLRTRPRADGGLPSLADCFAAGTHMIRCTGDGYCKVCFQ